MKTADFRAVGMWQDGSQFLVTLGAGRVDCQTLLPVALARYSPAQLDQIDSVWLEAWDWDETRKCFDWIPRGFLSLRGVRQRQSYRLARAAG